MTEKSGEKRETWAFEKQCVWDSLSQFTAFRWGFVSAGNVQKCHIKYLFLYVHNTVYQLNQENMLLRW